MTLDGEFYLRQTFLTVGLYRLRQYDSQLKKKKFRENWEPPGNLLIGQLVKLEHGASETVGSLVMGTKVGSLALGQISW